MNFRRYFAICLFFLFGTEAFARDIDDDLREIWEDRREIPAVDSKRLFDPGGSFETALTASVNVGDDFYTYFPLGLELGYHFTRSWALSTQFAYDGLKAETRIHRFLKENARQREAVGRLSDKRDGSMQIFADFTPFYGKWSWNTINLTHFSWTFSAGVGVVIAREAPSVEEQFKVKVYPEFLLSTSLRFFIGSRYALKIFLTPSLYKNAVNIHVKTGLAFSVYFPEIGGQ